MDIDSHVVIIKLIIAYTLVGAFIFTVFITCLSLIGLVKFQNSKQQKKLFTILIAELVIICVGAFADLLELKPKQAVTEIQKPLTQKINDVQAE